MGMVESLTATSILPCLAAFLHLLLHHLQPEPWWRPPQALGKIGKAIKAVLRSPSGSQYWRMCTLP